MKLPRPRFAESAILVVFLCICATAFAADPVNLRTGSLAALAAKAERGEALRIVTLGGSITQSGKGHSSMIPAWFKKRYPKCEVEGINVGLGSTCSHSGAFRLESHVLSKKPDLLVAEFAVNDDQDAAHSYEAAVRGMEGVVRHAYAKNLPVLVIMYVNMNTLQSVQKGEPAISLRAHHAVADHYGVPTVDVNVALANAIKDGSYSWKQYGGVHPNVDGYTFAMKGVGTAFDELLKRPAGKALTELPGLLDSASYVNGGWVSPKEASFQGDWKHGNPTREMMPLGGIRKEYAAYPLARANEPGATLTFKFTGTAVGAFVLAGPDAGMVEASVDGGAAKEIDLFHRYSGGLNYPRTVMFADGLKKGEHTLTLKVSDKKHGRSKGNACSILYFAVNR
jgi:lysophospholipase L1-like esterase